MGNKAKYCPECKRRHDNEYFEAYNARRRKGVRPSDVPDVPADDYDTLEEKIRKTAPIETVLVPKKEDNMDTERAERLKTFPSLSNRLEHPENFTQTTATGNDMEDAPKSADAARMERHKMLKALAMDKRGAIMSLYSTVCDISSAIETPVAELLDRLTRIDAALN
jgi:uncharacterized protein YlaI